LKQLIHKQTSIHKKNVSFFSKININKQKNIKFLIKRQFVNLINKAFLTLILKNKMQELVRQRHETVRLSQLIIHRFWTKDKLDLSSQVRRSLSTLICRLNTGKVNCDNPSPGGREKRSE